MSIANAEPAALKVSPQAFKEAMSRVSYSVSVVSTYFAGRFYGKTISTLAPVSADAPSVLISLFQNSSITDKIIETGEFCVSVLGQEQKQVAEDFAKSVETINPFERWKWGTLESRAPYIEGAVTCFDCTLVNIIHHASHVIMIGHINAVVGRDSNPLLHHRRAYRPCADTIIQ